MSTEQTVKKITVPILSAAKKKGKKIVMATAYDATFAALFDQTQKIDVLLVGDSLGMVIQGHTTTIPVTVEDIIYHTRAVSRGTKRAHICADMPFMGNKVSIEKTVEFAARLIQDGRAESVKIEGGKNIAKTVRAIVDADIPVIGHVGMTPQSVHAFGGFKTRGKTKTERDRIIEDAKAIEEAGAFALVLEGIPGALSGEITELLNIPTIGIGAGPHCDGQVLVGYDLLGINDRFKPKFLKRFATLADDIRDAIINYADEVNDGSFPSEEHTTEIKKR
ncbi:MAG: 3-methyl-2-oxobutanoate hydroxymethyltransferase [Deltaproteobacteria bacterium]|nr:3-methyl-2-oxobutanoate hydroxymethyltransferase [Deltaproteobacteria bacterium]